MGQTELAADIGITTSSATSVIDRMEKSGLVRRAPHPSEGRRSVVSLIEHGSTIVASSRVWMGTVLASIEDTRVAEVSELLASLSADLRRQTEHIVAETER
ncbi:MAG: MarR family transcriptional regulator [Actinomycetota bacterium]|nr:MarR family transcriptional regulator [Actinomycetota bacterium]